MALSHVSFVIGFGSSWSQPLFAKRPSRTPGSDRNASSRPGGGEGGRADPHGLWLERRARDDAVVQPSPPARVVPRVDVPEPADDVVSRSLWTVAEGRHQFVRGLPAVERRDERLDDRRRAVMSARVAPRFEEVRLGNVPVAQCRCLVFVQAEVHAQRHPPHRPGEVEVGRSGVHRIPGDDDEQLTHSHLLKQRECI